VRCKNHRKDPYFGYVENQKCRSKSHPDSFSMPSKIANATAPWEDDGRAIEHPKLSRHEVADVILDRLAALRAAKSGRRALRAVR
jgi:hypothetical protein